MVGNVRSINQDDVLGGEDELSPSEFGGGRAGDDLEIDDDPTPAPKKKSGLMPLIGGVLAAVGIVGFFGWKILSPYFGESGSGDRDAFAQISPAAQKPQPFNPETAPLQGAVQAAAVPPGQRDAAAMQAGVAPAAQKVEQPGAQVTVQSGGPGGAVVSVAMPADTMAAPAVKVTGDRVVIGAAPMGSSAGVADKPAPQAAQPAPGAGAEEIAQINKRIDGISAALVSLKETVEKLQAEMKTRPAAAPKQVAVKPAAKPVAPTALTKKSAAVQTPAAKKPVESAKNETPADAKPTVDLQLQAVLQDRAWFKTKAGETITVSAGEEVKGVGIVKQIDADGGRVVFTNGLVYR